MAIIKLRPIKLQPIIKKEPESNLSAIDKIAKIDFSTLLGGGVSPVPTVKPKYTQEDIKKRIANDVKNIGNFLLSVIPTVEPTYKKIKEGKDPIKAYAESWKELRGQEKQKELDVRNLYQQAKEKGASTTELSQIWFQSPMVKRATNMAIMGSTSLTPFKPGQMTEKMARDILRVKSGAPEKVIKDAFNKGLRRPGLLPKLQGIAKESGRAELELLTEARNVLLKKAVPTPTAPPKLIGGVAKKGAVLPITLKPITRPIVPVARPIVAPTIAPQAKITPQEAISVEKGTLTQEALKYKSAEEFVRAQGTPVYHGSPFKGLSDLDTGEFAFRGNSFTGKNTKVKPNAIYFSENPDVAKFFGTDKAQGLKEMNIKTGVLKVEPTVYERYLKSKKTLDLTSIEKADKFLYDNKLMGEVESALGEAPIGEQGLLDMIVDSGAEIKVEELWNLTDNKNIVDTMKKLGYDTVKLKETGDRGISYAVLDKNSLLTKSQLTDIWNKAQGEKLAPTKAELPTKPSGVAQGVGVPRERALTEVRGKDFVLKGIVGTKGMKPETRVRREVSRSLKERDYDKIVGSVKSSKELLQRRRSFIRAVQKQFGLSDADLKSITRQDIRLMNNLEFKEFLDKIRTKSEEFAVTRQARSELEAQIREKELNIEPLRRAMKFPTVSQMSTKQLKEFDDVLTPYDKGDVFLSKRKLETIERTELSGIRTYREAREILAKKLGIKPEELNNIKISEFDRFKGESGLAEKGPFFRMIVEETAKLRLIREAEFLEMEQTVNGLARKLKTSPIQKLIPQQKNIRKWFEATDKSTIELTKPEADLVKFMQEEWINARDYLVKMEAMKKGMKAENYFTHVRRGILEATKEDGVIQAAKEVFNQYKLDEQNFDILDTQTGEILAMDKFFRFALKRTGQLVPTENIVGAFKTYMRTFKKKQALDEIVPLIDIYAHALTPKGVTKEGLLLHGSLVRFLKEWLNTQKGRRITLVAKQGGKIDWALRGIRTFTTLMDIGLNLPVTIATQVGEQAITYQLLGKWKYFKAKALALTPKGKRITSKYRNIIGKNPWTELIEPMKSVGDRLSEGIFVMFKDANVRRNRNFLLGSLTKEEWATETISPERLGHLRTEMSRYGVMDGSKSIIGATPEAGVITQYKTWAIPILGSMARNLKYFAKFIGTFGRSEKFRGKRAFLEFIRMAEFVGFAFLVKAFMAPDEDDDSMIGKLKRRAYQEATTVIQAINPNLYLGVPRIWSWVKDLGSAIVSLVTLEKYKQTRFGEYEEGELKGLRSLIKMFTPRAIKQWDKEKQKQIKDINEQILKELESGELTMEAAKDKWLNEVKKLEAAQKKERLELPLEDYRKNLLERIESEAISIEDAKIEFEEYVEKKPEEFESKDEKSFIQKVVLYANAIKTDPVTAFVFMFEGEKIRKIEGGAIIVERMPLEESQAIKTGRGATKEMVLDHTIPLQLGGSNKESNLKLVSVEEWESYTIVENYLGDKLREGLIKKKEAQQLIKDFKEGKIKEEDIIK